MPLSEDRNVSSRYRFNQRASSAIKEAKTDFRKFRNRPGITRVESTDKQKDFPDNRDVSERWKVLCSLENNAFLRTDLIWTKLPNHPPGCFLFRVYCSVMRTRCTEFDSSSSSQILPIPILLKGFLLLKKRLFVIYFSFVFFRDYLLPFWHKNHITVKLLHGLQW